MDVNLQTRYTLNQKIVLQSRLKKLLIFLDALIEHSDDGDEISKFYNEIDVILPQEKASEFASKYKVVLREVKAMPLSCRRSYCTLFTIWQTCCSNPTICRHKC